METLSKDLPENKDDDTLEKSINKSSLKNDNSGVVNREKVTFVRADMVDANISIQKSDSFMTSKQSILPNNIVVN